MYSMVLVICCRLELVVGDRFPHIDPPATHEAYTSVQLQLSSTTSPYVKRLLNLVVKVFQLVEAI